MHAPSSIAAATRSHWFATTWLLAASLFCWYPITACDPIFARGGGTLPFLLVVAFFSSSLSSFFLSVISSSHLKFSI